VAGFPLLSCCKGRPDFKEESVSKTHIVLHKSGFCDIQQSWKEGND